MSKSFKFPKVMKEFKEGKLHSGSKEGPVVSNPEQAKAIAVSESKKAGQYAEGGEIDVPDFPTSCAWCGNKIKVKGEWVEGKHPEGTKNLSHGICPDCSEAVKKELGLAEGGEIDVPEEKILYDKPRPEFKKTPADFHTKTSKGETIVAQSKFMGEEPKKEPTMQQLHKYAEGEEKFLRESRPWLYPPKDNSGE